MDINFLPEYSDYAHTALENGKSVSCLQQGDRLFELVAAREMNEQHLTKGGLQPLNIAQRPGVQHLQLLHEETEALPLQSQSENPRAAGTPLSCGIKYGAQRTALPGKLPLGQSIALQPRRNRSGVEMRVRMPGSARCGQEPAEQRASASRRCADDERLEAARRHHFPL